MATEATANEAVRFNISHLVPFLAKAVQESVAARREAILALYLYSIGQGYGALCSEDATIALQQESNDNLWGCDCRALADAWDVLRFQRHSGIMRSIGASRLHRRQAAFQTASVSHCFVRCRSAIRHRRATSTPMDGCRALR